MSALTGAAATEVAERVRAETLWSRRYRARHALQSIGGRAYPRIFGMSREPSWLFFDLVFPILNMSSIVFLLRSRGVDEAWVSATILASALLTFWASVIWMMGAQFHWERDSGNLTLYITAPVGLGSVALGMAFGGAVGVLFRAAIIVIAGALLYGAAYAIADPLLFGATLLASIAAMYSLGICLSSIFLISGREADHLGGLLNEPMQLLGGVYAPVRNLGAAGLFAVGILPLAPAMDALRQLALPQLGSNGLLPVQAEIVILVAMSIVFGVVGRTLLAYIERVGRVGGKLLTRAD
jgi:ABC-2 type transport system permease protein